MAWMPMMRTRSSPPSPSPGIAASSVSPSPTSRTFPFQTVHCEPLG